MIQVAARQRYDIDGLISEIAQPEVKVVIFFFSVEYERFEPHKAIKRAFPQAVCIAASMIGGGAPSGTVAKGMVAMSLGADAVEEVFASFKEGVKAAPERAARQGIEELKRKLGYRNIDPDTYLGIVLFDGLCVGDAIMQELTLEERLNLPFVGGSAADEMTMTRTLVGLDDQLSADGLALLVMKMKIPFYCNHYVHYMPTNTSMMVTRAESKKRIIWEFNGEPAAPYYAKLVGAERIDRLDQRVFARNPLGVVSGDSVFCRSIADVVEGTGLYCFARIEAGTTLHLLKQGDIIADARNTLQDAESYTPHLQGAILFNCMTRMLEMQELKQLDAFWSVFKGIPFIGSNTYGEELFIHHNQTLTAVFFGGAR
ncbi:MAG: FIST C-terminal domain-containing protein [Treponema sp.]|jgi:hypothetical protein|nr:FIST C-terminal domain-containing protein [Treponema sp.]